MTVNEKGQLKNKGGWRNMEKKTAIECLDRIIDELTDDQFGFLIGAIGYLKEYINSRE